MSPAGWILITRIILWLFLQRHHLCKCANANELTGKTQTWGALRVAYVVFLPTEQIVTYRIRTVGHFITHESQHQHALQESTIVPILARESAWLNLFRRDMRHQSNWSKKVVPRVIFRLKLENLYRATQQKHQCWFSLSHRPEWNLNISQLNSDWSHLKQTHSVTLTARQQENCGN